MAGANVIVKKGQQLFKEGEGSDGMYLIRKGEVLVYLEKGGAEVKLANLGPGAMLGEMSLFDKKPRSASARATQDAEVTRITNDDFNKLMKQIPKWFVSLMASLSSRLRDTNERLQAIEAKMKGGNSNPLNDVLKVMNVMSLLWHKDGTKEGSHWLLEREKCEEQLSKILDFDQALINRIIQSLSDGKLLAIRKNNYKKDVLYIGNRGSLERFSEFTRDFVKAFPDKSGVPMETVQVLECVNRLAEDSAYDAATISLEDVMAEGKKRTIDTTKWKEGLPYLSLPNKALTMSKGGDGQPCFKVLDKKALPRLVESFGTLHALRASGAT